MLVLTRKLNEDIVIQVGGQTVVIRVVDVARGRVRIGVIAPPEVLVNREEIAQRFTNWQQNVDRPFAEVPS